MRQTIAYVEGASRPMQESVWDFDERGMLPRATYMLPDGTPMAPADHPALLDDAGGNPADAEEEAEAWLSGEYGAWLHSTSPEAMVAKGTLMTRRCLLSAPADARWRAAVREAVDSLDALERPFAAWDRERFGGPSSRDRLITATRERSRMSGCSSADWARGDPTGPGRGIRDRHAGRARQRIPVWVRSWLADGAGLRNWAVPSPCAPSPRRPLKK